MHIIQKFVLSLVAISSGAFAAEEAVIKIKPDTTVSYRFNLNADFKQNIDKDTPPKGKVAGDADLLVSLVNEKDFPELIFTILDFKGKYEGDGTKMEIDSKKAQAANNDLNGLANLIGRPLKIPLTTNRAILTSQSPEYPMLPVENPEGYISFVQAVMGYITEGATFIKDDGVDLELRFGGSKLTLNSAVNKITSESVIIDTSYNISLAKDAVEDMPEATISGFVELKLDRNNALVHQLDGKTHISFSNPDANVKSSINDNVIIAKYSVASKQLTEKEALALKKSVVVTKPVTNPKIQIDNSKGKTIEMSDDGEPYYILGAPVDAAEADESSSKDADQKDVDPSDDL